MAEQAVVTIVKEVALSSPVSTIDVAACIANITSTSDRSCKPMLGTLFHYVSEDIHGCLLHAEPGCAAAILTKLDGTYCSLPRPAPLFSCELPAYSTVEIIIAATAAVIVMGLAFAPSCKPGRATAWYFGRLCVHNWRFIGFCACNYSVMVWMGHTVAEYCLAPSKIQDCKIVQSSDWQQACGACTEILSWSPYLSPFRILTWARHNMKDVVLLLFGAKEVTGVDIYGVVMRIIAYYALHQGATGKVTRFFEWVKPRSLPESDSDHVNHNRVRKAPPVPIFTKNDVLSTNSQPPSPSEKPSPSPRFTTNSTREDARARRSALMKKPNTGFLLD